MLKPTDLAREFAYPLSNASVLMSSLLLFLLLELAAFGRILGLFLALLILPALLRYLMRILDARAKGQDAGPLVADDLLWFSHGWSLFPAVHIAVLVYATYFLGSRYGLAAMLAADVLLAIVVPASLAVLAITRSPLESLSPKAVGGLIRRCGEGYWILPTYFLAAAFLSWWLSTRPVPDFTQELVGYYLVFGFFALIGGVVQPYHLHQEVRIHDAVESDQETLDENLLKERTTVLNHAYGFISRDNRAGGLQHIHNWMQRDPEPDSTWQWFFEQMLLWEIKEPALVFAQSYLSRLLQDEEYVMAVKLMMRCRLINEAFKPLPDDKALALEAAEYCGNDELLQVLRTP